MQGLKLCVVFAMAMGLATISADDLSDYPIKEEVCDNFGECLTECVKKLPPTRQFTDIVRVPPPPAARQLHASFVRRLITLSSLCRWFTSVFSQLDCSDQCALTHCKEVEVTADSAGNPGL
jgi:hypothetical protein